MKKSKFPALALATTAAQTVLSAATINPFSLARVASKSKFLSVFGLLIAGSLWAAQPRQVDVHDPALAKEGDTYYLFSSGPGITFYSSKDMKNWELRGRVFPGDPSWAKGVASRFNGHVWAPDIAYHQAGTICIMPCPHQAKTARPSE
jgi:beta-xylosidase